VQWFTVLDINFT